MYPTTIEEARANLAAATAERDRLQAEYDALDREVKALQADLVKLEEARDTLDAPWKHGTLPIARGRVMLAELIVKQLAYPIIRVERVGPGPHVLVGGGKSFLSVQALGSELVRRVKIAPANRYDPLIHPDDLARLPELLAAAKAAKENR